MAPAKGEPSRTEAVRASGGPPPPPSKRGQSMGPAVVSQPPGLTKSGLPLPPPAASGRRSHPVPPAPPAPPSRRPTPAEAAPSPVVVSPGVNGAWPGVTPAAAEDTVDVAFDESSQTALPIPAADSYSELTAQVPAAPELLAAASVSGATTPAAPVAVDAAAGLEAPVAEAATADAAAEAVTPAPAASPAEPVAPWTAPPPEPRSSPQATKPSFPDLNALFDIDDDRPSRADDDDEPTAVLRFRTRSDARATGETARARASSSRSGVSAPMSVPPVRPPAAAPPPGPGLHGDTRAEFGSSATNLAPPSPSDAESAQRSSVLPPLAAPGVPSLPLSAALGEGLAPGESIALSSASSFPLPPVPPPAGASLPPLGPPPSLSGTSLAGNSLPPPVPPPAAGQHHPAAGTLLSAPAPSVPAPNTAGWAASAVDVVPASSSGPELNAPGQTGTRSLSESSARKGLKLPIALPPEVARFALPALGAFLLLLLWLVFRGPSTGQLVVTVSGPNSEAIANVEVVIDGRSLCDRSPCTIAELTAGTHLVRAGASGFAPAADQAVVVQSGQTAAHNFSLARLAPPPGAPDPLGASAPMGAQAVAATPQAEPVEEQTTERHATESGSVEARAAEPVAAATKDRSPGKESPKTATAKGSSSKSNRSNAPTPTAATSKGAKSNTGTLNLASSPPSTVVLDGRPLGRTPRAGISVSAGSHTVVFVHPQHGRKTIKAQVSAGGTKTVSVRF